MFLRFVKVKIRPDRSSDFQKHYDARVRPELERTQGCLFAALMANNTEPIEAVSMTIWDTAEDARRYERSGVYRSILDEARPFILEADEWRMKLADDKTILRDPDPNAPEVTAFPIQTGDPDQVPEIPESRNYYLRIVSARTKPGELYRMISTYEKQIVPRLLEVDGCRSAFLARGHSDPHHVLSITLWDSREKAAAYEEGGLFDEMHKLVKPMLSSVSEWKMALDPTQKDESRSGDLRVKGWQVVSSKEFSTVSAG